MGFVYFVLVSAVLIAVSWSYDITLKDETTTHNVTPNHESNNSKMAKRVERMVPSKSSKRKKVESAVDLVISEINFDSPSSSPNLFIEIEIYRKKLPGRQKTSILDGHFLLFITSSPFQVVMSANLGKIKTVDPFKKFVVIGTSEVNNLDMDVGSVNVQNSLKGITGSTLFPQGDVGPVAVVIAYQPDKENYNDLFLFKSPQGLYLPTNLANSVEKQEIIRRLSKDVAVVGRKCAVSRCEFFDSLLPFPLDPPKQYLLRDFTVPSFDYSMNRCCKSKDPYKFNSFRIGVPSPGVENDCSGQTLILEHEIGRLVRPGPNSYEASEVPGCSADFQNIPSAKYKAISEQHIKQIVEKYSTSPFNTCPYKLSQSVLQETSEKPDGLIKESDKAMLDHQFQNEWREQCKTFLPKQGIVLGYTQVVPWVHVDVKENECRFSCFFCRKFFEDGFRVDIRQKKDIQTSKGLFSKDPSKLQSQIISHCNDDLHKRAHEYVESLRSTSTVKDWNEKRQIQESIDLALYKATIQVMEFTYIEIISDVSFSKHPLFMSTLSKLGLNVGTIQHSEKASREIMQVYSLSFHKRLLQNMVKQSNYFTLIADGTTYRGIAYLVVLFQTVLNSRPAVFFYCLIPLDSEKGSVMVNHLINNVQKDENIVPGFESYFKSKLIAQSSDSASNMVGSKNSFYTHLEHYVKHKIGLVKCFGHKLELSVKNSMKIITSENQDNPEKSQRYFTTFGITNNELFTFYFSRGSKRFHHLSHLAEEMGLSVVRLRYFFDIRWASSHKSAMFALKKDYDILIEDLQQVSKDSEFEATARDKARYLYDKISDKTFIVCLCEMLDVLTIYEQMSLQFQTQDGVMLEKAEVVRQGIRDLNALKFSPGKYLKQFLSECSCHNVCEEGSCSLEQYDACETILRLGKSIKQTDSEAIKLSLFRIKLYESFEFEIRKYFPLELLESYSVFNPKYFKFACPKQTDLDLICAVLSQCYDFYPSDMSVTDPIKMIDTVCNFYHIAQADCTQLKTEWALLLASVVSNEFLHAFSSDDPTKFWSLALTQTNLEWRQHSKRIIEYLLVTSTSSASAERAFSYVTAIQHKERSSLTPENLEMIARIKINGPTDISKLDSISYAKEFLKHHRRVDEEVNVGGRPPHPEKFKSYFHRSDIF